jgi:hypothetical protein
MNGQLHDIPVPLYYLLCRAKKKKLNNMKYYHCGSLTENAIIFLSDFNASCSLVQKLLLIFIPPK